MSDIRVNVLPTTQPVQFARLKTQSGNQVMASRVSSNDLPGFARCCPPHRVLVVLLHLRKEFSPLHFHTLPPTCLLYP